MKIHKLPLALWLAIALFSGVAQAEKADKDKPIDIEADNLSVNDAKKTSIYTGNVILTKGTLEIHADKLIVREDAEGFQHSTSTGNPTTFKQKMEGKPQYIQGSGLRIEYDGRVDKVQIYEKAWFKRGEDMVNGDYIMYDASSEYAEVLSNKQGSPNSGGRVRATIQPKKAIVPSVDGTATKPE